MDYRFIKADYLESVSAGDPEIIREIVTMFKEQSSEIYNEMNAHFKEKNYKALGLLAHKAKSSVLIMGMNDLGAMLKAFEIQAKDGKESELYQSYIIRFRADTEAAIIELDDLISNSSVTK
jgi:HPt (histidine-containing phosphotransfer) domain-containing protein